MLFLASTATNSGKGSKGRAPDRYIIRPPVSERTAANINQQQSGVSSDTSDSDQVEKETESVGKSATLVSKEDADSEEEEETESVVQFKRVDDVPFMLNGLGRIRMEAFSTDFLRQLRAKRDEQATNLNITRVGVGSRRSDYIDELMRWKKEMKRQYNLRGNVSQKIEDVWKRRDHKDVYTLFLRSVVEEKDPEVDHVMEIQIINRAFGNAHMKNDSVAANTRDAKGFLFSTVNDVDNLNVTPHTVNQAKKGPFTQSLNRILADEQPLGLRELASQSLVDDGTWARIEGAVQEYYDQLIKEVSERAENALTRAFQDELHDLVSTIGLENFD